MDYLSLDKPYLYNPIEGSDAEILCKSKTAIRVVTYNILTSFLFKDPNTKESWKYRKNIVVDFIKRVDSDILALQEVTIKQMKFLKLHLSSIYTFSGFATNNGCNFNQINATDQYGEILLILYKKNRFRLIYDQVFWLSSTPNILSTGWDASRPRIIIGCVFEIINTHQIIVISNTHYDHLGSVALLESGKVENHVITELMQKYKATLAILVGDRNCLLDKPEAADALRKANIWYRSMLIEHNLFDVRNSVSEQINYFGLVTTYFGYDTSKSVTTFDKTKQMFTPNTVDLIFVKGNRDSYKIIKSMCLSGEYTINSENVPMLSPVFQSVKLRQFASDHAMVVSDIELCY